MGNSTSLNLSKDDHVTKKITESGESKEQSLQYAVSGMKGRRNTMEDKHISCLAIPVDGMRIMSDHSLFAVFDGHGGEFTSHYLEKNFLSVFSQQEELAKYHALPKVGMKSRSDVNGVQLLKQALLKTFVQLDEELLPLQVARNAAILSGKLSPPPPPPENDSDDENSNGKKSSSSVVGERSGSTGVVVVLTPTHIICANAGDSRALLRRFGKVFPLSFDHKPSELPERQRILKAGGIIKGRRVDGDLAVSRAFGDFIYKENKNEAAEKQKVIVVPDTIIYPRDKAGDEFIILACDGVWDVASNKQCSDFVQLLLSEGEVDLGNICEEAIDTCLDRNSSDNMTMMLVGLKAMKSDTSSAAAMNNALWGKRATRKARQVTRTTAEVTQSTCALLGSEVLGIDRIV